MSTIDGDEAKGGTMANPFPGPRPFAESEDWLFFGRDRELSDLVALLFAQRAVLLHGPSGGGKSSLVNAGLIPRARGRGFDFLPVARVRDVAAQADDDLPGNRYVTNVIDNWQAAGLEVPPGAATLVEALSTLPAAEEPGRVLIFDQFEELFVLHPESWKDRVDLLLQVQAALDRDPLLHVLFVLRDEYLARLQPLTPVLRDRLSTR
ncbi:MAG: ATP-binding protein, partial [Actinobacteria bacterium]|nr:ATP-binding protein [Actinomycetota bacterium]